MVVCINSIGICSLYDRTQLETLDKAGVSRLKETCTDSGYHQKALRNYEWLWKPIKARWKNSLGPCCHVAQQSFWWGTKVAFPGDGKGTTSRHFQGPQEPEKCTQIWRLCKWSLMAGRANWSSIWRFLMKFQQSRFKGACTSLINCYSCCTYANNRPTLLKVDYAMKLVFICLSLIKMRVTLERKIASIETIMHNCGY